MITFLNKVKKILYISPQSISGTLPLLCEGHRRKGNYARYVTLFPTPFGYEEDLQMNLRLHPDKNWIIQTRNLLKRMRGSHPADELPGNPPFWKPGSFVERTFFNFRDWLNSGKIHRFIAENGLDDYDIYHLEQGTGFFRDCRVVENWRSQGKKFVTFYHGNDIRNRGVYPDIHRISALNLTSELDLLEKYPGIRYLFLPIDTDKVAPVHHYNEKIKIVHATRSRFNKGSDFIIATVKSLEQKYPVELVLIENKPHAECMVIKAACDICIDQIADKAGWGYGMNSVESLAQGIPVCTYLNEKYLKFIPDHPFVNVNYDTLQSELISLIENPSLRADISAKGRNWVVKTHSIDAVMEQLYNYYEEYGIL